MLPSPETKPSYFEILKQYGVNCVTSTRLDGNMAYVYGAKEDVESARLKFFTTHQFNSEAVAQLALVHGTKVEVVTTGNIHPLFPPKYFEGTDGLITNRPNVALVALTGDCAPVTLFDQKKRVIGLVHSGWRGTIGKISQIAVEQMVSAFGTDPKDIIIGIGPSIEKCCYVTSRPAENENLPEWSDFCEIISDQQIRVDLNGFIIQTLLAAGVPSINIFPSGICTKDHADVYFSSKFEKETGAKPGRFATVVQMK